MNSFLCNYNRFDLNRFFVALVNRATELDVTCAFDNNGAPLYLDPFIIPTPAPKEEQLDFVFGSTNTKSHARFIHYYKFNFFNNVKPMYIWYSCRHVRNGDGCFNNPSHLRFIVYIDNKPTIVYSLDFLSELKNYPGFDENTFYFDTKEHMTDALSSLSRICMRNIYDKLIGGVKYGTTK